MKPLVAAATTPMALVLLLGAGFSANEDPPATVVGAVQAAGVVAGTSPGPYRGGATGCVIPDPTGTGGCVTGAHIQACGLPRIRLHDTRHGACSLLLAGGVPIEIVRMILGHSSPTVTRRVYAHVLKSTTARQVEAASELLTQHRRAPSVHNPSADVTAKEEGDS